MKTIKVSLTERELRALAYAAGECENDANEYFPDPTDLEAYAVAMDKLGKAMAVATRNRKPAA